MIDIDFLEILKRISVGFFWIVMFITAAFLLWGVTVYPVWAAIQNEDLRFLWFYAPVVVASSYFVGRERGC
jgi:hypothetical protein